MTAKEILAQLQPLGKETYKRVLVNNHNVKEPCFGVPVSELKKFQQRIKKDYQLALNLYATGNYDAMYLAGLIADDARLTRKDLQAWVEMAQGGSLPGATVAWVAAGSPHDWEMAIQWIDSKRTHEALAGWGTLASLVAVKPNEELSLAEIKKLIQRVCKTIQKSPDRVRRGMNSFLIAVGCYVKPLSEFAIQTGEQIGQVTADLGGNDCQIPFAPDYIRKVQARSHWKKAQNGKMLNHPVGIELLKDGVNPAPSLNISPYDSPPRP